MTMKQINHDMNLQKWTQKIKECRNSGKTAVKRCEENNETV